MKTTNQRLVHVSCLLLCAMASLSCITKASAQIVTTTTIYQDPLLGTAAPDGSAGDNNNINRRQPVVDTTGASWSAVDYLGPNLTTAGLADWRYGNNESATAMLPITMDGVGTYTLNVNAFMPGGGYNSINLGFVNSSQSNYGNIDDNNAAAQINVSHDGNLYATFGYGASSAFAQSYSTGTLQDLSITINSATGDLTFSNNGVAFDTIDGALQPSDISSISDLALGFYYAPPNATFSNLSLTESVTTPGEVPEPSTYVMMIGGLAALVFIRRIRSANVS